MYGVERWLDKVRGIGQDLTDAKVNINKKITTQRNIYISKIRDIFNRKDTASDIVKVEVAKRKLKLVILGDSLVRGVGCDFTQNSSPVLPTKLANLRKYSY